MVHAMRAFGIAFLAGLLAPTPGCASKLHDSASPAPARAEAGPGTVLMVLSAASRQPLADGRTRETGYFLNEFHEPYRALVAAGYTVAIATPGGRPPALDPESLDEKYWTDPARLAEARRFVESAPELAAPLALGEARSRADAFQGIIVPGGQGVMIDLLEDPDLHALVAELAESDRPVGLVCHAPAILARLPEAARVRPGARVTSVSGFEEWYIERFVMGAKAITRGIGRSLAAAGYRHRSAAPGRAHAVRDCNLVTSQNPFSGDAFSRHYLAALADFRRGGRCPA